MTHPLTDPERRIVVAHRGDRVHAPENTVDAFTRAISVGADAIELDVRMTRDGVAVVVHDPTVDRTTNGAGLVSAFTLTELQALDASARFDGERSSASIPALEEVLDRFRDIPCVIEVKELAAAEETERLVRRFGAEERVVIGSADARVMDYFYRSTLRRCASMRDASRLIPAALLGLAPTTPRYHVLSVTPRFRGLRIPIGRMAVAARKAGIATQVWTVNDPDEARRYWRQGVSGIVSDDPAAILRARRE